MSLGMSTGWRAMQPKKKRCERCGLYYTEKLNKCSHCGDLDDLGLQALLDRRDAEIKGYASIGRYFILGAVAISILLLLII